MRAIIKNHGDRSYAVKLDTLSGNDFFTLPFGRQLDDLRKVEEFKCKATVAWVGAKGRPTLAAVKQWVKDRRPTQFYSSWQADSSSWKSDSVAVWFTE